MVTIDELFPRKSKSERRIGPVDVHVRNNWCEVIFSDETKVVIGADKKFMLGVDAVNVYTLNAQE